MLVQIGREGYSLGIYAFVNHIYRRHAFLDHVSRRNAFLDHVFLHLNVLTWSFPTQRRDSPKAGLNNTQSRNCNLYTPLDNVHLNC